MNRIVITGFLSLFLISNKIIAQNPIVPDVGMADPNIKIFHNKAYLYTTRDADKNAKTFIMPDWHIWSSDDLTDWKHELTIQPTETYIGESNDCWATDVAYKNGKYYLYFSNKNINTGVMVADSPAGPFKDALGKPMIDVNLTTTKEYDPTILIDDDKDNSAYLAFGHYRKDDPDLNYYIAKLNNDMVSLAEEPKEIIINGDADVMIGNDKPNLHKHNGTYYLSAGSHYATSTNVYGPYIRRGNSGNNKYGLNSMAHGNYFEWNNQCFHTWCHFYLGNEVARYRESYITYLHYKDNGEMVSDTDFLDQHFKTGVGQYDASWEKIEAEWYMAAKNNSKRDCPNGGFEIQEISNGSYLYFPKVQNIEKFNQITFYASSKNGGLIEIREGSVDGKLLGTCKVKSTGGWEKYQEFSCELTSTKSTKNIYLKFVGEDKDLFHLDWFKFKK